MKAPEVPPINCTNFGPITRENSREAIKILGGAWSEIGADLWVMRIVQWGYKIPFVTLPPLRLQGQETTYPKGSLKWSSLSQSVQELRNKGAIEPTSLSRAFIFTVGHCSIPPYSEAVLHCTTHRVGGRSMPSSGLLEGVTVFAENAGLVVGRTLVDPSGWRVPVLVSNFGQETVMVEPFSEIGMFAQVSAIQPVMDQPSRPSCDPLMLPDHLQGLLDLASHDLDNSQRGQLASTLLQFVDLFPVPGSALTCHTDAVEHTITPETVPRSVVLLDGCLHRRLNRKKLV